MYKINITQKIKEEHLEFCNELIRTEIERKISTKKEEKNDILDIKELKKLEPKNYLEYVEDNDLFLNNKLLRIFLSDYFEEVILGSPMELEQFSVKFDIEFKNCEKTKIWIESLFRDVYDIFSGLKSKKDRITTDEKNNYLKNEWSARHFIKELNIQVCPYCNMNYIHIYYNQNSTKLLNPKEYNKESVLTNATIRPDLDHFYPKGNGFPILAMSVNNLIPSCKQCNQQVKKTKNLDINNYIHPYMESIDEYLYFFRDVGESKSYLDALLGLEENFRFNVAPKTDDKNAFKKACRTLEFFHVIDLYDYKKEYIQKRYRREMIYSKEYLESLSKSFPEIHIFSEYLKRDEINDLKNETMGKLINDLFDF